LLANIKKARYEQLHDKIKDKEFYNAIKPIHNMFLTDKNIEMLQHISNATEAYK